MADSSSIDDILDSLPTSLIGPSANMPDDLPTEVGQFELIIYPASDTDGSSVQIRTRVPPHWLAMVDAIRDAPGTNLPDVFPTQAAYFRWCIIAGFAKLREIAHAINQPLGPDLDERLGTLLVLENIAGDIEARARITTESRRRSEAVMAAVQTLIAMHEELEAANLINRWVQHAQTVPSTFYQTVLGKALFLDEASKAAVRALIEAGLIDDEWFLGLAETEGQL